MTNIIPTNRTRLNLGQRLDHRMVWSAIEMNDADLRTVCAYTGVSMPTRSVLGHINKSIPAARARFAQRALRDCITAQRVGVSIATLRTAYPSLMAA